MQREADKNTLAKGSPARARVPRGRSPSPSQGQTSHLSSLNLTRGRAPAESHMTDSGHLNHLRRHSRVLSYPSPVLSGSLRTHSRTRTAPSTSPRGLSSAWGCPGPRRPVCTHSWLWLLPWAPVQAPLLPRPVLPIQLKLIGGDLLAVCDCNLMQDSQLIMGTGTL